MAPHATQRDSRLNQSVSLKGSTARCCTFLAHRRPYRNSSSRVRFHRRLRRIPWHLPRRDSRGRSHHVPPRISRRMGRHSGGSRALDRRADYACSQRSFALHSLRSPELSRLYVQCDHDDAIEDWPDERIWSELLARLARRDGWTLTELPILEKRMAGMRSFVVEPMQYRRLFLAGDAAHMCRPPGPRD